MTTAGEKTALDAAIAARPLEQPEPAEQIDMLAEMGLPVSRKVEATRRQLAKNPPNRPPGSRNKRTVAWADYLLSQYTSPLVFLAQTVTTPTAELAAALKCTVLEAHQEKRLAAQLLKEHVHSKMPIAVDVTNRKVINLVISDDGGGVGPDGAAGDVEIEGEFIIAPGRENKDG